MKWEIEQTVCGMDAEEEKKVIEKFEEDERMKVKVVRWAVKKLLVMFVRSCFVELEFGSFSLSLKVNS